jgi:hypothetical protein
VQFVDYKVKDVIRIPLKPMPSSVEHRCFDASHKHDVQHRVIRYQYVGWMILHIPTRPHLPTVERWEEPARRISSNESSVDVNFPQRCTKSICVRPGAVTRYGRAAGIATEVESVVRPILLKPCTRLGSIESISKTRQLVLDEGIQGVQD